MFFRQAIASALHLFVVFALLMSGIFFVLLPYLPITRMEIIDFLSNRYEHCTEIGMGFFFIAFVFFIGFYAMNRGKYLVIRMGVLADLKMVHEAVDELFHKKFGQKISLREVGLGTKSRLDFKVQLAVSEEAERGQLFVDAEQQLSLLLHERFGYSKPFHLIVKI